MRRVAHRGQEKSRRRVLDMGGRIGCRRRHTGGDATARPFRRRAGCVTGAALRRLRGRQRHHAAHVDHRHDAGRRARQRVHVVLRQSRVGHRDVSRRARRVEGHVPHTLQPRPRAVARGTGHSAAARAHRSGKSRRAARPLGRSRQGRRRLSLRTRWHDAGGRRSIARARVSRHEDPHRALRREHPEARA